MATCAHLQPAVDMYLRIATRRGAAPFCHAAPLPFGPMGQVFVLLLVCACNLNQVIYALLERPLGQSSSNSTQNTQNTPATGPSVQCGVCRSN